MGLTAKFDVHHPVNLPGSQVDALLRDYGFPYLQHLHLGADGPKKGLDFAIEEVCRVLGIQEGKYNGLRFDEFVEQLQEINMSTDKDAYESEVMLILMDKLHNENRSLHHALAKSNAEIRKQTAETQREREELKKRTSELYREIKRLNDVLAKLRELADSQEEELQQYKLEKAHIQHVRTQRHLDKEEYHDKDIYCITLQEYIKEQGRVARLQQEIQEEERKNQERLCTLQEQNQQLKTLMEEKTKEMDELQLELRVFRQKRRDSQAVRVQDGLLTTDASPKFASEQNSETVHPHVLANEPLFSVTLEELNEIRNTNVKLAEEMVQKAGIIRELEEILTQKETKTVKLETTLTQREADNEKLAEDLAQREADNEKLAEELAQREADNEKLAEELAQREADNEKLTEELAQREADNEKLTEDLRRGRPTMRS
ncbi:hypothetical protein TcBrA4_0047080 [Trypanosoma cruzi]|nr:hypothetical protein TcBrA4_0047080 [Trypanosoma cruzi]